ncbi:hypothetical protein EDB92DRAFT_1958744 [Lactarius akahatsu]|uniref:DUF6535 domain-containing protein n=1 Tax=Lactarius akahatsu TaxID=416441 RepID=A0AAD4Q7F0_9AGAM|nr:hypothetical protein EDB92DRAFT_1958744 [Lactarius akahatsu]
MDRDIELQPTNNIEAERIRGIHNDSSGKLWSIYLTEADERDREITELWRGEADSILVFTGLFSGVIATFLAISYSNLLPSSAETTNFYLAIIIEQLASNSSVNGVIPVPSPLAFTPSASAIRVNVIWFLSLVLSITSAVNATLFQQWARRYLELTRRRIAPHKRARTRAYMYNGIASFKMSRAVKAMPILLHLSIFLFFVGLIDFLWNTNSTVGSWIFGSTMVFTFAYLALTVLPNLCLNCPYSTPVSEISWHLSHRLLLFILLLAQRLDDLSLEYLFAGQQSSYPPDPSLWTRWRKTVKTRIDACRKWLEVGLQNRIMINATEAPPKTDENALSWTLTVLDDDREFEDFVARVPGFFDSTFVPKASSVMLSLMKDRPSETDEDPVLGSRINDLLRTCVPGISPLPEQLRKNRLRVCMRTLWYFAREYNQLGNTIPLPSYVRTVFANPEMSRRIQSEDDPAAHLIGRCFSSLVARKLTQDIQSRTGRQLRVDPAELSCLAAILSKTSPEVVNLLRQPGEIGLANIVSLMSSKTVSEKVPLEVLDIFIKTLNFLFMDVPPNAELPPDLVAALHEATPLGQRSRVLDLQVDRLRQIMEGSSVVHGEPEVTTFAMTELESGSGLAAAINTTYISFQSDVGSAVQDSLLRNVM